MKIGLCESVDVVDDPHGFGGYKKQLTSFSRAFAS